MRAMPPKTTLWQFSHLFKVSSKTLRGAASTTVRERVVSRIIPGYLFTHNCLINSKHIGDVAVEVIPAEPEVSVVCDRRAAQTRLSFLTLAAPVLKLGCWVAYCGGGEDGGVFRVFW